MKVEDVLIDSIIQELEITLEDKELVGLISKKLRVSKVKKRLFYRVTKEIFYMLLTKGKIVLPPGYGSVNLKDVVPKEKKVFDKKTRTSVLLPVKRRKKVGYTPGYSIKEFL